MKTIYIPGIPQIKMRPRFSRKTGHAYDPNAEQKEASIQKAQLTGDVGMYQEALAVQYYFVFPRPKNHFGTGKNSGVLKATAPIHCTNPKDIDNLEKFYSDSFNFIHYRDDAQIVSSSAIKRWAHIKEVPHVQMIITEL